MCWMWFYMESSRVARWLLSYFYDEINAFGPFLMFLTTHHRSYVNGISYCVTVSLVIIILLTGRRAPRRR